MDVIHVQWPIPNGLGALFLKIFYKIPYINTIHGEEVYLSKRYHTTPIIKLFVNQSAKTLTNSSETFKVCLESGLNREKLGIIPFGVDMNFFRPINVEKDKNIFQILSVGYLIERKGFEYLIKAMENVLKVHNNVKLMIVGSGPLETKLKTLIKDLILENNIQIISNVTDEGLLKLYNSSDIFVLPSIVDSEGNTEGLGVVLLEAMACKIPVIGSNIGGIPDIVHNGETGLLVLEKDKLEISRAIIKLIENENLRERISVSGYKMVKKHFNWDIIAKKYITVYNALLKEK